MGPGCGAAAAVADRAAVRADESLAWEPLTPLFCLSLDPLGRPRGRCSNGRLGLGPLRGSDSNSKSESLFVPVAQPLPLQWPLPGRLPPCSLTTWACVCVRGRLCEWVGGMGEPAIKPHPA